LLWGILHSFGKIFVKQISENAAFQVAFTTPSFNRYRVRTYSSRNVNIVLVFTPDSGAAPPLVIRCPFHGSTLPRKAYTLQPEFPQIV
jgi:hypothetical protein